MPEMCTSLCRKIWVKESEEYQVWLNNQPATKLELFSLRKDNACFVKKVATNNNTQQSSQTNTYDPSSIIRPGDQLVSINGHDVTTLSMEQIQQYLKKPPPYTEELQKYVNAFPNVITQDMESSTRHKMELLKPDNAGIFDTSDEVSVTDTDAKANEPSPQPSPSPPISSEMSISQPPTSKPVTKQEAASELSSSVLLGTDDDGSNVDNIGTGQMKRESTPEKESKKSKNKRRFLFLIGGEEKNKSDAPTIDPNICLVFRVMFENTIKQFCIDVRRILRAHAQQIENEKSNLTIMSSLPQNNMERTASLPNMTSPNSESVNPLVISLLQEQKTNGSDTNTEPAKDVTSPRPTGNLKEIMLLCGLDAINNVEFRTGHPQLFWNLVWHLSNLRLPLHFFEAAFDNSKDIRIEKSQGTFI
ncbi:hypothetical protein RFI_00918 [Reticulomyxa filosa]|uniref:PDZ domain-containing protein n=1 Tax=Reticulomyxa filosa TaxID=46433 RepID=X6PDL0_RETFI|nr:hypothetical protein RFI_00918 [Reticulomyxa filosa]|eukprot:ETO36144.1 hypothetical protein RFI_00918 [Reticulomyxa filosa]